MAKGFTVKAKAPTKKAEEWDYQAIKTGGEVRQLFFVYLDVDVLSPF